MMPAFQSVKACPKCLCLAMRSKYLGQTHELIADDQSTYKGRDVVRRTCVKCGHFWDERPADYEPPTESEQS